jgi:hypothetical protein
MSLSKLLEKTLLPQLKNVSNFSKQTIKKKLKCFVRSGIRTHAHIRGPEHSYEQRKSSLLSLAP